MKQVKRGYLLLSRELFNDESSNIFFKLIETMADFLIYVFREWSDFDLEYWRYFGGVTDCTAFFKDVLTG